MIGVEREGKGRKGREREERKKREREGGSHTLAISFIGKDADEVPLIALEGRASRKREGFGLDGALLTNSYKRFILIRVSHRSGEPNAPPASFRVKCHTRRLGHLVRPVLLWSESPRFMLARRTGARDAGNLLRCGDPTSSHPAAEFASGVTLRCLGSPIERAIPTHLFEVLAAHLGHCTRRRSGGHVSSARVRSPRIRAPRASDRERTPATTTHSLGCAMLGDAIDVPGASGSLETFPFFPVADATAAFIDAPSPGGPPSAIGLISVS